MSSRELDDADRQELTRLVTEAFWRIDHGQADTLHELFVEGGSMTIGPTTMASRDEIASWGKERAVADYITRHVCTNTRFLRDPEEGAAGTVVVTVYRHTPAGETTVTVAEYTDSFVRASNDWRFASRRSNRLMMLPAV